jgi:broad specificity phosphatase PhoE
VGRLLLIRHGQSEGNAARCFTATPEVPLTEVGREQVRAVGRLLGARYMPRRIATSPFRRARETADILAGLLHIPVAVEEDLRERSYGTLAGQPYAAARNTAGYDPHNYWLWCPPGGEDLNEVTARAGRVLDRLTASAPEHDVVIVSHGAVMLALWRHVTGQWKRDGVAPNAGLVVVEHAAGAYGGAIAIRED